MRAIVILMLLPAIAAADEPRWWTDYSAARKEAEKTGKAMCMVVGSDNCFYCRKLEASTLIDPAVSEILKKDFIAIKLDGNREPDITRALGVQVYPTTVLAASDGSIHAIVKGYAAPEQFGDNLRRTLAVIGEDNRLNGDLKTAKAAIDSGEYARALVILRSSVNDYKTRPGVKKAKAMLEDVEKKMASGNHKLQVTPQMMLQLARHLHEVDRPGAALDVAAEVIRLDAESPEASAAQALIAQIQTDKAKLTLASRQADAKAASLLVSLSEAHEKSGDAVAARECLEQALRISPDGPHAEMARFHLTKLKTPLQAVPATLKK